MDPFDQALRTHDFDRWLSSRFVADADRRARLVALYSLDGEWRRVAALVTTPLAGEIRLAWWSEAVERFAAGGAADHPALEALGRPAATALQDQLQAAIEAYRQALETERPAEAADAAIVAAAARLLDPDTPQSDKAFPAIAHRALARAYAKGRTPGPLEKRLRITWAVLMGRV